VNTCLLKTSLTVLVAVALLALPSGVTQALACSPLDASCECAPRDLQCQQVRNLSPTEKRVLKLKKTAAHNANLFIQSEQDGATATIKYYDYGLGAWFAMTLQSFGVDNFIFSKMVWSGTEWVAFGQRSHHPTDPGLRWSWENYVPALAAIGKPNTEKNRTTLDGRAAAALASQKGLRAVQDLLAAQASGGDADSVCRTGCAFGTLSLGSAVGIAGLVGCGLSGGTACELIAYGLELLLHRGNETCVTKCKTCYEKSVISCRESGTIVGACVLDSPWTCRNGVPVPKRTSSF
jgi:hypothetical protein